MVPSRSSSSGAPVRANLRRRRSAILMLRVPSSTSPSRSLNSRLSHTFTARLWRLLSWPMRMASGGGAVAAKRRSARRADPLRAALVAALLLGEAFRDRLHELFPAERLDLLHLLGAEIFLRELLQPLGGDLGGGGVGQEIEPLEHVAEDAVELIEVALVLHQRRARQVIEILHAPSCDVGLHGLHQRKIFPQRHRQARGFQLVEEGGEHAGDFTPSWPGLTPHNTSPPCNSLIFHNALFFCS